MYRVRKYTSRRGLRHFLAYQSKPAFSPLLDNIFVHTLIGSRPEFEQKKHTARLHIRKALLLKDVVHFGQCFGLPSGFEELV